MEHSSCSHADADRLALLSGDWIPVRLPEQIQEHCRNAKVISLGGATEVSIWSIWHRCDVPLDGWVSVPYGRPLANQNFRILDRNLRDCPVWAPGDLFIGGEGLAIGYLNDDELTSQRFIFSPDDGRRLYRTGDKARYRPGGIIEFLGREDNQVKIRGHRIELQEVEAALQSYPGAACAAVILEADKDKQRLLGFIESARQPKALPTEQPERMRQLASNAADREVGGLQRASVERWIQALDSACLASIMNALVEQGAFRDDIALEADEILANAHVAAEHRWLDVLTEDGYLRTSPEGNRYIQNRLLTKDRLTSLWEAAKAAWSPELCSEDFYDYLRENVSSLPELLTGTASPTAILFPEGNILFTDALYRTNVAVRYLNRAAGALLHRISLDHSDGQPLRILEAGAGTGATTEVVLRTLAGSPVDYLFTDVAPFFLPEARRKFGAFTNVRFSLFDLDASPMEQGFLPNSFDVIIAAGAIENARNIQSTLDALTELLVPGGWLLLIEPGRELPWVLLSQAFMMTPPEDDRRGRTSYLSRNEWVEHLKQAGADDIIVLPDDLHPLGPQSLYLFAARMKADRARIEVPDVIEFLTARLPQYMIPTQIQVLDRMPLTANGKIDRSVLRSKHLPMQRKEEAEPTDHPMDELEQQLAAMWAKALGIDSIGRSGDLFRLGADSLISARMAGRMREEVTEARDLSFDSLLRQILKAPTVADLANFLRSKQEGKTTTITNSAANSMMRFNAPQDGLLRVMFHAGLGTMECYRPLAQELVSQELGHVVGLVIADAEDYCALKTSEVIAQLADHYTEYLLQEGNTRFQLIGYCLGGLYAVEVARRLTERGKHVEDLVLTSSHPVLFDIQDDLVIETMFVPNIGLTSAQMGFGETDSADHVKAFMHLLNTHSGKVPENALIALHGTEEMERVGDFYRRMASEPQEERFQRYASMSSKLSGKEMSPQMVASMFRTYRQSFRSAHFTPEPYAGDIRFLLPSEGSGFAPGMDEMTTRFWQQVCIGDLTISRIGGNHFTCMMDPHVKEVANHIAGPLRGSA